ncbi:GAF and ANTAR domain-containing protein [Mycolicibacterium sarraceniae]|uniref:Transcriptional regulator n=1 Tax=Mycolicibacterium sarraceniae TaxID=1534348 RepID=A0A7I7SU23_9MYCO|nr:GAF and ANTAR domain-containing protein [Mycolicibacterium sarraceniae]BBY60288.1 transcriptional regulator [Mycolicibacterium sarraceniae]
MPADHGALPPDTASRIAEIAHHAAAELPGADYVNVTVTSGQYGIDTPASTHPWAERIDAIQRRHREGPCVSSSRQPHPVHVEDLTLETRWPRFRAEALDSTPVRSIMGFPLFVNGESMGTLNVFAERPHAFGERTRQLGSLFADHVALVCEAARRESQFQEALASRDIIGQAKGMIMERYSMDADQAFEMLRQLSRNANVPLAEVAAKIIEAAQANRR